MTDLVKQTGGVPERDRHGLSPFDHIAHFDEATGEPWWSAREMASLLKYSDWRNMENVVRKARAACRNSGQDPEDHFADTTENSHQNGRPGSDVRLTRFACYLVAMNGDPDKAEVAASQQYFAVQTRKAELAQAARQAPPPPTDRSWSARLSGTWQPHIHALNVNYPDHFTTASVLTGQLLQFEDELIRHMFEPKPSDRPDGSIGACWAHHRRSLGLPPSTGEVPLWLPDLQRTVMLHPYPLEEYPTFIRWFNAVYVREKLPLYLGRKPEFLTHGPLPPASVADHICRHFTGRSAKLPPTVRKQLAAEGGFVPAKGKLLGQNPVSVKQLDLFGETTEN